MAQQALIALGSNLGDSLEHLRFAYQRLASFGSIEAASSIYQTAPIGSEGQDDYLNAVLLLNPVAVFGHPQRLLGGLLALELERGRERRQRWEARTLDLDLLAFDDLVLVEEGLSLPHPQMMTRAFVLCPLAEIQPRWCHPLTGQCVTEALASVPLEGVRKTSLTWST